jgi:hypothetical protein
MPFNLGDEAVLNRLSLRFENPFDWSPKPIGKMAYGLESLPLHPKDDPRQIGSVIINDFSRHPFSLP